MLAREHVKAGGFSRGCAGCARHERVTDAENLRLAVACAEGVPYYPITDIRIASLVNGPWWTGSYVV
jgi:hypothetical protein